MLLNSLKYTWGFIVLINKLSEPPHPLCFVNVFYIKHNLYMYCNTFEKLTGTCKPRCYNRENTV